MTRHDPIAPTLRLLECPVIGDIVTVDGLAYGLVEHPHPLRLFAHANRVTVLVDQNDIDTLLVRNPRDGGLHRLQCLSSRATRLAQLARAFTVHPGLETDECVDPPKALSAA